MMFRGSRRTLARRCTAVFQDGDVTDGFQHRYVRNGRAERCCGASPEREPRNRDVPFLRQPKGVVPTERAKLLATPVADILERARQVIANAEGFDPRKAVRRFVIGAPDAVTAVILPSLLADLRRDAPGIDLGVRNLVGQFEASLRELDERSLDVALLPIENIPARFVTRTLFEDEDFVIVRRVGHPIGKRLTLARYCAAPHVLISVSGDPHGMVDRILEKRGAMPRRFAARYAARYRLVIAEPPIPPSSAPVLAVAPQVATADEGLTWLLGMLERAGKASRP